MKRSLMLVPMFALLISCGGDKAAGPSFGPPVIALVNGVTKPTGLVGMTVIIEGSEFALANEGRVYFRGADGSAVQATVDPADWHNTYIVTTVPQGTADSSLVWVQTRAGVTDSIEFRLISANTFSPSNISWTRTTDLPQALQGLGAAFVPVEFGAARAKYIFTVGGAADQTNIATQSVFRGTVQETGAISTWDQTMTALPAARAYHATAAATHYTARIDTTIAGYLYAIGGIDASGTTVSTVLYSRVALDGTLGPWQSAAALPSALHSAGALVYRGYLYVTGGADGQNRPTAQGRRAEVRANGTLGSWESIPALPAPLAHHGLVNFGPYLYVIGGDSAAVDPAWNGLSGGEVPDGSFARIDLRTGAVPEWTATAAQSKARSKHSVMAAGASVVVTSGMYSGQAGSSENAYATIGSDGSLSGWAGATGGSTIQFLLGYSLYNQAAVAFTDASGNGHVVVLGGANRSVTGQASAAVVYY